MACKNCGTSYDDGIQFCPCCGTPAAQPYDYNYQMPPDSRAGYQQTVSVGQYIGWTLLAYVFGPISLILTIVFACMNDNRNRTNFFRAQLVVWGISITLFIIAMITLAVVGISLFGMIDDVVYSYDILEDYLSIAIRAVHFFTV